MYGILALLGVAIIFLLVCLRGFQAALKQGQNCGAVLRKGDPENALGFPRSREQPASSSEVVEKMQLQPDSQTTRYS